MNLFCNMDGVLANWNQHLLTTTGSCNKYTDTKSWATPDEIAGTDTNDVLADFNWWVEIPKTGAANILLTFKPTIVTTPWKTKESYAGKRAWIDAHAPGIDHIFMHDKHRLVHNVYDVLIDDREENIDSWVRAGGTGILFAQPWNSAGRDITDYIDGFSPSMFCGIIETLMQYRRTL